MNKVSYSTRSALLLALLGAGTLFVACGDGAGLIYPPDGGSTTGSGGGGGGEAPMTTSGGTTSSTGSSMGTGGAMPTLAWIAQFDATKGELAEGLVVNKAGDTAYVGYAPTGKIVKITLADGKVSAFGTVPMPPPMNKGAVVGLALDATENLYVAVASFDVALYQPGIYKIPAAGGAGTMFASDPGMTLPNGLVFDATGNLFAADSGSGSIFKIDATGVATKWVANPLLEGDTMAMCAGDSGLKIGANGIALSNAKTDFYVTNTNKASVVKIAIKPDGTAGMVTDFVKTDCLNLVGADGLSVDTDGSLLIAANRMSAITRVSMEGKATIFIDKDKLDSPSSTWISTAKGEKTLFITNSAFHTAPGSMPKPGLLKLPLGG
jgi:sugar lactone lactonase YvrE